MDIKRFKENLTSLLLTSSGDAPFANLRIMTHGMAGVRTAKIINFACRCMGEGEIYLEVGTFSGYTLVSAGYQNNSICIGVDDFSMKEVVKPEAIETAKKLISDKLKNNLFEYGSYNTRFVEANFRDIGLEDDAKGKICTLFIDGDHNYQEVKDTMEKFAPYLSKDALIIFDDVQFGNIPDYIQWMMKDYELLTYVKHTVSEHDSSFHKNMALDENVSNGICVMARKN